MAAIIATVALVNIASRSAIVRVAAKLAGASVLDESERQVFGVVEVLARCTVKSHEDFPRHIYRLFLLLGIQFRWLLTRGTLARALVTSAELASMMLKKLHGWKCMIMIVTRLKTSFIAAFKISGPRSLIP
jgi:hypothetical protein